MGYLDVTCTGGTCMCMCVCMCVCDVDTLERYDTSGTLVHMPHISCLRRSHTWAILLSGVLNLAITGGDVLGVVSFHEGLERCATVLASTPITAKVSF
jgi:hypothetical protein